MTKDPFALKVTGGAFIAAALMLWFGWVLLPVKIGTFFEPGVFGPIHEQFQLWIWMFRIHIFGMTTTVIALFALAGLRAMALTMALPDHLRLYMPIFHANVLWLLATGIVLWRRAAA